MINSNKYITPKNNLSVKYVLGRILLIIYGFIRYVVFVPKTSFILGGERYSYFYHRYNMTWDNERCVELPVVRREMEKFSNESILEVGNVLSHYFHVDHDIVDKYEIARNVINQDIIDFSVEKKYDLIVSISTIEHIGWDESPKDVGKILVAIEKLKKLLNPNGRLLITLPIGYNKYMDALIFDEKIHFDKMYFVARIDREHWVEVECENIRGIEYGRPFRSANGLIFAFIYSNVSHQIDYVEKA